MITLYFFGRLVEQVFVPRIGASRLRAVLPVGDRGRDPADLRCSIAHDANYRSLGASGAVSAVLFAFILMQPWSMIFVFFLPMPAIVYAVLYVGYSIWMDHHGGDNINHSAHLWGAAYGVMCTLLIDPECGVVHGATGAPVVRIACLRCSPGLNVRRVIESARRG